MRLTRRLRFLITVALLVAGCASPQEKAMKRAMKDYQRASAGSAAYAKEQVANLVRAAQTFRTAKNRWPHNVGELAGFAWENKLKFDVLAFNEASFAAMSDGTLQVLYDVNCVRFNTATQQFAQRGTINVKPPPQ